MATNWKMLYAVTKDAASAGETPDSGANTENNIGKSSAHTELEAKTNAERIFDGISVHPMEDKDYEIPDQRNA